MNAPSSNAPCSLLILLLFSLTMTVGLNYARYSIFCLLLLNLSIEIPRMQPVDRPTIEVFSLTDCKSDSLMNSCMVPLRIMCSVCVCHSLLVSRSLSIVCFLRRCGQTQRKDLRVCMSSLHACTFIPPLILYVTYMPAYVPIGCMHCMLVDYERTSACVDGRREGSGSSS